MRFKKLKKLLESSQFYLLIAGFLLALSSLIGFFEYDKLSAVGADVSAIFCVLLAIYMELRKISDALIEDD